MGEGGAGSANGGGGGANTNGSSSMRSKRPLHRQQEQQQQQSPEIESAAGSKRRREDAPVEASAAVDDSDRRESESAVDDADVAPPAAKQARGLYGRVSGLVGRAVNLLTPGRPRRATAAASAATDMEGEADLEAGTGTTAAIGVGTGAGAGAEGAQEPAPGGPAAAAVSNERTPAGLAPAMEPAVTATPSSRNGVVGDGGVGDTAAPADPGPALFSPGIAQRSGGPHRHARRGRVAKNDAATWSSRRVSGDGLGPASLRGSTAGDGAAEEFSLPPVPPFYPLGGGGGGAGHGDRSATTTRAGVGAGRGGARPLFIGGAGDGPAGPRSAAAATRKKSKGKGRGQKAGGGGVAQAEPQDEEEEEEEEGGREEDRQVGVHAAHTATERRDLFRSRANYRGLSAWEMLYLLGHLRDPEATLVKERCVQIYNQRIADAEAAIAAAQGDSVTGTDTGGARQQHQQQGQRRRKPDPAVPLLRPSAERMNFPPGADLVPSAPSSRSSPPLMRPPPLRAASGFPAAATGRSQGLRGGGGGGQFGVRGGMPPPPGRGGVPHDLLTPAKRAQVEAERGQRDR